MSTPHDWTPMRIRDLRVRLGKTQEEFAAMLSKLAGKTIERSRIAKWEGGFSRPALNMLEHFRLLDQAAPPSRVDPRELIRG